MSPDSKELNICNAISEVSSKPVKFQVSSVCNFFQKSDINVFVVNALNVQPNSFKISPLKNDYPYIRDINFPILNSSYVDLLIGTNKADLLLQRDFRQCDTNEPLAIKTCLGWMLMGVYSKRSNREKTKSCNHITKVSNESLSKEIERFWQVESYGTLSKLDLNLLFPTEQQALQILENNTILKNGLFETPLLWKSESPKLPNNGTLAEKWFQSLENKFAKNPEFAELYRKQINEYIDLGHAVNSTNDHSLNISEITNYVHHHDDLNINKPGQVGVVFDAFVTCLNQNLVPDPDLLNNLVSVLIRFCQGKYDVMADIEKMFHQVFASPNDTDALSFLSRKSSDEVVSDYKMLAHIFGKVELPSCAIWSLRKVPEMVGKLLKEVMANNFYMDNFLSSLPDEESLIRLPLSLISCLKTCGFRLTKWVSKSKVILENIPSSELSPKFINLDLNSQPIQGVLVMIWNVSEDFLCL